MSGAPGPTPAAERSLGGGLAPTPILDAVEGFRGSIVDLDRGQVVDSDHFRRASYTLEKVFRTGGLSPGDRPVVAIGNGPMFMATLSAILRAGGSPLLLHADSPAAELGRTAQRFGANFLISDSLSAADLGAAGFEGREFSCSDWASGTWARTGPSPDSDAFDGGDLAGVPLHPTSGTTGQPKLAVRPGSPAVAEARHYIDAIGIDENDSILCTIPMSHAYGYGMCVMVPLLSGATVLSMRRFNAKPVVDALAERRVTIYPTVPLLLDILLVSAADRLVAPRCITSAGAPQRERTAARVKEQWGAAVRPLYGTTETGGITVARPNHDTRAVGSVGPPMKNVSVEVRPVEDPQGSIEEGVGELWVSSPSLMAGYLSPTGIDRSSIANGWFNTGDLARIDERGEVRLLGRASEVINVFGNKVLPGEVEEVISLLPGVAEVKVYSAPNRWGSNSVKAAVVATDGATDRDVRDHCETHLVSYKRPEGIVMLDALPRSPAGKIVLSKLP
jgi:acyl-CoA synthetase (AMP-forming)/AMP-acid ligase II